MNDVFFYQRSTRTGESHRFAGGAEGKARREEQIWDTKHDDERRQ